jgi:hypothetical protein
MDFTKFKGKRIYWLATGFILVVCAVIFGSDKNIPTINYENQPDLGEWKVTEFTGSINYVVAGGSSYCDKVNENYYPIVDDDQTFIKFFDGSSEPKLKNIPLEVYDTLNLIDDVKGLFIFQFSFDNGYHSNAALESFNVPYHYTEVIRGLWTFEVGLWTEVVELAEKGPYVYGDIIAGNKWGGKSSLTVTGRFKSENKIEGQWEFSEVTAGPISIPECEGKSYGSGKWVAIKK